MKKYIYITSLEKKPVQSIRLYAISTKTGFSFPEKLSRGSGFNSELLEAQSDFRPGSSTFRVARDDDVGREEDRIYPVEERRLEAVLGVQSTDYRIHGPCYLSTIEFQIVDFAL